MVRAVTGISGLFDPKGDLNDKKAAEGAEIVISLLGAAAGGLAQGLRGFSAAAKGAKSCFVAGTVVETDEGPKPIEELRDGDLVLSQDEESGATSYQPVATTFERHGIEIYELTIADNNGVEELIETTCEHPFWVVGRGWVKVAELESSDELLNASGEKLTVGGVVATGRADTVYNIEVAGYHTYFVGEHGAWVHNKAMRNPLHRLKSSKSGPKIADPLSTSGVPRSWSRTQIGDAITNYRASIASRKAELAAFDAVGGGNPVQRLAHARRITGEEAFLRSLEKALGR